MTDEPKASEPEAEAPKKRNGLRWLVLTPLALFLVLAGVSFSQLTGSKPQPATFTSPTRPVPKMSAPTLDGQSIDFAGLRGPVIVNFWATWCTPCKAEHPILMQMKAKGVSIVGVQFTNDSDRSNLDAATGKARAMLDQEGNPFRTLAVDPSGDVALSFGIAGVPESFLVDAKGMIVKTTRGPLVGADADAMYDAYKAEVAKAS